MFNLELLTAIVAYLRASIIANIDDSPIVTITGIGQETQDIHLQIFPNPAEESFTINLAETEISGTITITNLLGENIYTKTVSQINQIQIDIKEYASGVYLVKIKTKKGLQTATLIIRSKDN